MMKQLLIASLLLLPATTLSAQENKASAPEKTEYRVGERLPKTTPPAKGGHRDTAWEDLAPRDWDPMQLFRDIDLSKMNDGDPRAMEVLERMRKAWSEAPTEPAMHGARIRIDGFVVPLDMQKGQVKEFLLVPYFGACIHTPPPPANQIIHVKLSKPLKNVQVMDAVWVSGTLDRVRAETGFGTAGYSMRAETITPFKERK